MTYGTMTDKLTEAEKWASFVIEALIIPYERRKKMLEEKKRADKDRNE
jgi:hypothetical protein